MILKYDFGNYAIRLTNDGLKGTQFNVHIPAIEFH